MSEEKPWAVYPTGFGKVTRKDEERVWITSFEKNSLDWIPYG